MIKYAILCGISPDGFRQKKLNDKYIFLASEKGEKLQEKNVLIFLNGINELFLEYCLNNIIEELSNTTVENTVQENKDEIFLYFCFSSNKELKNATENSNCKTFTLGNEQIRKELISYYKNLLNQLGINLLVECEADSNFIDDEALGYEKVG